jgi:hypothetical protein
MPIASQQFIREIQQSHTVVSRVEAWKGDSYTLLDLLEGQHTYSYDDASRTSYDFSVVDSQGRSFEAFKALLDPYQTRYVLRRGVKYVDGSTELIEMGTLYGTEAHMVGEHNGLPKWQLKCFDQSIRCQNDLKEPFYVAPGQSISNMTASLLKMKRPNMVFNLPSTQFVTPVLVVRDNGSDPWTVGRKWMASVGQDMFMDRNDVCTAQPRTGLVDTVPVWHFAEGVNATFWEPNRNINNDNYPNVIVVVGDNPVSGNVSGYAADEDPKSPTWVGNGEIVRTEHSEVVTTPEQAKEMARYILAKLLGPQDEVELDCIPNPLLDVGNTVKVTCARYGLEGDLMIITRIDSQDGPNNMHLTARRNIISDLLAAPIRK